MAHIAKYKATSVGHMLAHYRRDESSLGRDNIDPKRVKNDIVVAHYTNKDGKLVVGRVVPREGEPNWGTVERRIERVNEAQKAAGKRATRKDAVVMADDDFTVAAMNDFDGCYWEIIVGYNGTLERYCRGNYLKRKAKAEARDAGE